MEEQEKEEEEEEEPGGEAEWTPLNYDAALSQIGGEKML